jgi:hypothetical protein
MSEILQDFISTDFIKGDFFLALGVLVIVFSIYFLLKKEKFSPIKFEQGQPDVFEVEEPEVLKIGEPLQDGVEQQEEEHQPVPFTDVSLSSL